jgi:hypothetical protein
MAKASDYLVRPLSDGVGDEKVINNYLDEQVEKLDIVLASPYTGTNAVHTVTKDAAIDGGNYTLTFRLQNGQTFTTASLIYTSNAAAIQTAIDVAAAAVVSGWVNGSIVVTGGNIATNNIVLTFSGTSTSGTRPTLTEINDVDIETGAVGEVTETTPGVSTAPVLALVSALGWLVIPSRTDPTGWTRNTLIKKPVASVCEYVARQAAYETGLDSAYTKVIELCGYNKPVQPRSSIVV